MRIRITFSKTGSLRYTGHLDLHKIWERTIRRAGLPLAYTQGFHPGPKIQLASALPLGFASRAELVDLWLDESAGPLAMPKPNQLQPAAPPGLTILQVEQVDERAPALQNLVASAEYQVTLLDPVDPADLQRKVAGLLAAPSLPRERRGKPYDLRPLVEALELRDCCGQPLPAEGPAPVVQVAMKLAAREGATGRPEEVLDVLGIPLEATRIERTRLEIKFD